MANWFSGHCSINNIPPVALELHLQTKLNTEAECGRKEVHTLTVAEEQSRTNSTSSPWDLAYRNVEPLLTPTAWM